MLWVAICFIVNCCAVSIARCCGRLCEGRLRRWRIHHHIVTAVRRAAVLARSILQEVALLNARRPAPSQSSGKSFSIVSTLPVGLMNDAMANAGAVKQ